MAKKRRPGRKQGRLCSVCLNEFFARRDDARLCSPKCRKQEQRARDEKRNEVPEGQERCGNCGVDRDPVAGPCDVCGGREFRK